MRRAPALAAELAVLLAALAASGCGGSGGGGGPAAPPPPRTASPLPAGSAPGVTAFAQKVPAQDLLGELFPGQANSWGLERDFSLSLGFGLELAIGDQLAVGRLTPAPADPALAFQQLLSDYVSGTTAFLRFFPADQRSPELTFLTPLFGTADGLEPAAVATSIGAGSVAALAGSSSAFLAGTADSRLARTVTLAAGQTYSLSWVEQLMRTAGPFPGANLPPYGPRFQVVLRDPATGAALGDPLFVTTALGFEPTTAHTVTFTAASGPIPAGPVDLSFELRARAVAGAVPSYAAVDTVALSTAGGPVASFTNGDFEAGLAGWRVAGAQSQNVRSGARPIALDPALATTLLVTRTFYAPPAAPWARMVDVFENDGDAEVVTTVLYASAHFAGASAAWTDAGGKAAVGRDTLSASRDVGIVYGAGVARFDAASTTPQYLFVVHPLRVPAHGRAALVHFYVQLGQGGLLTGPDHSAAATAAACQAVAAGFRVDPAYQLDLEPGVLALVQNL